MRLRAVYPTKFDAHYRTEQEIRIAKREWAKVLGGYSREQIDSMFSEVKRHQIAGDRDFDWPEIGRIVGLLEASREWRAFEQRAREMAPQVKESRLMLTDSGARQRAESAAASQMQIIKQMLRGL